MKGSGRPGAGVLPRRVEVLAGLSVAIDLGLGQPAEHMLRSATIACRLSDRLGLDPAQRSTVFYSTLVMWIGCHADSQEYARWFGDDIAVRREAYLVDWSGLPYLRFLLGNVAKGEALPQRLKVMGTLFQDARGQLATLIHSHCSSAAALAQHVGLSPEVGTTLAYTSSAAVRGDLAAALTDNERYAGLANLSFARPVEARTWLQASNPSERWKWDVMFQDLPPVKFSGTPKPSGAPFIPILRVE